jgi:hypothetical protein
MTQNRSKPWAIVHAVWPKMHVFVPFKLIENNLNGVKTTENRPETIR